MSRVTVDELRDRLSEYLERVKAGEDVLVTDAGVPVARITPADGERERLLRMEREGEIVLGPGGLPEAFWAMPYPKDPHGSAVRAELEEREAGW